MKDTLGEKCLSGRNYFYCQYSFQVRVYYSLFWISLPYKLKK